MFLCDCVIEKEQIFGQKTLKRLFLRNSSRDQVHCQCGSFFGGPDVTTRFRWPWSKIKGTYNSNYGLAKNGQNQGWAPENDPYHGNGNAFGDGTPVMIAMICSVDKMWDSKTKNWLLAPNIKTLGSKFDIFGPGGTWGVGTHQSMSSTRKRCYNVIGSPLWGYQNFCFFPKKIGCLAQSWHFWSFFLYVE